MVEQCSVRLFYHILLPYILYGTMISLTLVKQLEDQNFTINHFLALQLCLQSLDTAARKRQQTCSVLPNKRILFRGTHPPDPSLEVCSRNPEKRPSWSRMLQRMRERGEHIRQKEDISYLCQVSSPSHSALRDGRIFRKILPQSHSSKL